LVKTRNAIAESKNLSQTAESAQQQNSGQEKAGGVDATSGYDGVDHDVDASVNSKYEHSNGDQEVEVAQEQTSNISSNEKQEVTQGRRRGR
jgi:hypothetical protein